MNEKLVNMTYPEYAAHILGAHTSLNIAQDEADFNVDAIESDQEMEELISIVVESHFCVQLDNLLYEKLYDKVIDKAVEELGLDRDKFEQAVNCSASYLFYDGTAIYSWDDLYELSECKCN